MKCDVAIIGGGPAGSTVGALLKRYEPSIDVAIIEREHFPREHVGESHLPAISQILDEIGVWDKVEAANFPVKIGGTYRWGATDELWDLSFIPGQTFMDVPRPGKYEGQRRQTAFQVDRSVYDKVLLDHARGLGCNVNEGVKVTIVETDGDRVTGLKLSSLESEIEARYYVDCSGDAGILRRAFDIGVESPTALRNIAIWDYWQDAEWAITLGTGGTLIQIMSLGWGWLWFIPISPTRTSVGFVLPASYYKATGKSKEAIYSEAIKAEPLISKLLSHARPEGVIQATKDWNFVADRLCGDNWFLAGDSCGFADPILSAGMTLAHTSGRKVAYIILDLLRGNHDPEWLKSEYTSGHRAQIKHHMQFADFWYSSNGRFTDLKEYCSEIAETAGLTLDADSAFRWLATGGFALEAPGVARALSYSVSGIKYVTQQLSGSDWDWQVAKTNLWLLKLSDATEENFAVFEAGCISKLKCYRRGDKILPVTGVYQRVLESLKKDVDAILVINSCLEVMTTQDGYSSAVAMTLIGETIEALIAEGWVKAKVNSQRPMVPMA